MRTLRAAFVVTLTAACTRAAPPPEGQPRTHNPPALPEPPVVTTANPPAPVCPPRDTLRVGDPCAVEGLDCYAPTGGCQPSGFRCHEGRWQEVSVTCNPPPPPDERRR